MKQIDVAEIRLNVFDEGSGPPLVFVHGFPLSHAMWLPQLQAFRTTHRVVAPDLRGFGGSTVSLVKNDAIETFRSIIGSASPRTPAAT